MQMVKKEMATGEVKVPVCSLLLTKKSLQDLKTSDPEAKPAVCEELKKEIVQEKRRKESLAAAETTSTEYPTGQTEL